MSTNAQVAKQLLEIADMLDLLGEKFKPEAYRRAARSIESLGEDLRRVKAKGGLDQIPGVGEAISGKIAQFLTEGKIDYLEKLRRQFPPGLLDLMQLPGIGPKTARRFWVELGIEGPAELIQAIDSGRLQGVRGFGERKIALFRAAAAPKSGPVGRMPLRTAHEVMARLLEGLRARAPVDRVHPAGSLRRSRESVGDLDIVATSTKAAAVFDAFAALPGIQSVSLRGDTKMTVFVAPGIQVDLRVVEPEAFGAALQYFTGSKEHNIHLRTIARDRGLKVNEYGVWKGEERVAGASEEEVYGALGLDWMPPEIRENRGEIEAAQAHSLPKLIERSALHGDLHAHLSAHPDAGEVGRWISAAQAAGLRYLGLILPRADLEVPSDRWGTSLPSPAGDLLEVRFGIELPAAEAPVARPGGAVDFWVATGPARRASSPPQNVPPPLFASHLGLASEGSETDPALLRGWIDLARDWGSALEIAPGGAADGLDSTGVRQAVEAPVPLALSAGAHQPEELSDIAIALGIARRGWLTAPGVLNAQPSFPGRRREASRRARSG
ncbi:MAG TPA: helix-hairpin-helix domain-containing protein [Thermoplasmata archaeon]|nr:helix-hairpin-helix domain-containing protein [Thermoplasmata archaeon]